MSGARNSPGMRLATFRERESTLSSFRVRCTLYDPHRTQREWREKM